MEQNFKIANRTDVGAVRQVNEDSMITFDSPNGQVVVVCDGMGGQAAGDLASRLACDIIQDILSNNVFGTPAEAITRAVMAANQGILHRAASNPDLDGMGSTCVIVIVKDGQAYYGWIGDSRIYYYSGGVLRQISKDESYVQQLVDAGQITAEEAENHPQKNEITNALGFSGMTPPQLCAAPITPEPGSVLLLCSDGLSGMVDNAGMQHVLSNSAMSIQEKVDTLVSMANAAGGLDNITVQLIEFGAPAAAISSAPHASESKSGSGSSNRTMLAAGISAVVLLVAFVSYYFVSSSSDETLSTNSKSSAKTEIVDERSSTPKSGGSQSAAPSTSTKTVTTTRTEKGPATKTATKTTQTPKGMLEKEGSTGVSTNNNPLISTEEKPKPDESGMKPDGSQDDGLASGKH
ncbi:MAG: Stp1/IreP family PP2C-type Ser/Thr phosphatase [Muribaculaceae bacterium]|nr:Stp1/IreP family PP2C-type Ser/Thr phosphatase [Muribaculaceae bacterium]